MRLRESALVALSNIAASKVRYGLSILGVLVGTMAVIVIAAVGAGSRETIMRNITALGSNTLFLWPIYNRASGRTGRLTMADVEAMRALPFVASAGPYVLRSGAAKAGSREAQTTALGVSGGYTASHGLTLAGGRDLLALDAERRSYVCLVSEDLARELFGGEALGRELSFQGQAFKVVGVLRERKQDLFTVTSGGSPKLFIPDSTLMRLTGQAAVNSVEVQLKEGVDHATAKAKLLADLERGPDRQGTFRIYDPESLIAQGEKISNVTLASLVGIAAISMFVGGIGIMNVMLASVAERTREIGLRKALGARDSDILVHFLVDGCVVSGVGGFLGCASGLLLAAALPDLTNGLLPTKLTALPVAAALIVSVGVGLVFSLFPAYQAARLSPMEALRYE